MDGRQLDFPGRGAGPLSPPGRNEPAQQMRGTHTHNETCKRWETTPEKPLSDSVSSSIWDETAHGLGSILATQLGFAGRIAWDGGVRVGCGVCLDQSGEDVGFDGRACRAWVLGTGMVVYGKGKGGSWAWAGLGWGEGSPKKETWPGVLSGTGNGAAAAILVFFLVWIDVSQESWALY